MPLEPFIFHGTMWEDEVSVYRDIRRVLFGAAKAVGTGYDLVCLR